MSLQQSSSYSSINLELNEYFYMYSLKVLRSGKIFDYGYYGQSYYPPPPVENTFEWLWRNWYYFDSLEFNVPDPSQPGEMDMLYNLEHFSEPPFPYNWEDFWVVSAT